MPKDMLGRGEAVRAGEALDRLLTLSFLSPPSETIAIEDAYVRVLAKDVVSPENLPDFSRSTMDGYAVNASDTFGCSENVPAYLKLAGEISIGAKPDVTVKTGKAIKIPTGGMLPGGADAVVMFERVQDSGDGTIEVLKPVAPGDNVVQVGEDIKKGEKVLSKGKVLRPYDIAAMAGLGITKIEVFRRPVVGIISTGDEIVDANAKPGHGKVRDVNSYSLAGLILNNGGEPRKYGIFKDEFDDLREVTSRAVNECDMVLISGGSSVGTRDMTADIIDSVEKGGILFHGVAVKPGKPLIAGFVKQTPVFGLPGHPAAVSVSFTNFVEPVLKLVAGMNKEDIVSDAFKVQAILTKNVASAAGREDHVRVMIKHKDGRLYAEPVLGKSGLINTLVRADGLVKVPEQAEGLREGDAVEVRLLR